MPVGIALTFWPLFVSWNEMISVVLWRNPSGAFQLYLWLVLPTVTLVVADVFIRGSLRFRWRAVFAGAGAALAIFLIAFFPLSWTHLSMLVCEWQENCLSVEQSNSLKGVYSDAFAVQFWLVAVFDAAGCFAWSVLLAYRWLASRKLKQVTADAGRAEK